jgi:cytosine/adenosine deaminase-related metal-dependent hydrolase
MDRVRLFQARWIVPVSGPVLEGGVIAVRPAEIVALGKKKEIAAVFPEEIRDLGAGVILPGLVNAHTHVELSAFRGRIPSGLGFVGWVRQVLALKELIPPTERMAAAKAAWAEIERTGTAVIGDWASGSLPGPEGWPGGLTVQRFQEIIGFTSREMILPEFVKSSPGEAENPGLSLGAHAPHSTSAVLLRWAKAWTRAQGRPLAIHAAESREEMEFLRTGGGIWKDFLMERGKWAEDWRAPETTPVKYLEKLNLLDEKTLAVHLTLAEEDDLAVLRRRGTPIAVCPRSNQFITGALPPISAMLRSGLEPALGTDSLASNRDLDLWKEMETVAKYFPEIDPEAILRMATINGASALHLTERGGDLAPGKKARMFFLPLPPVKQEELAEAILHSGGAGLKWLD